MRGPLTFLRVLQTSIKRTPLLLGLLALSFLPACSERTPKQEISETFKSYRQALLDGNGASAWSLLDSHTTKFYAQVVEDALNLPGADLNRLDFVHKFMILRLRVEFRRADLHQLTGQALFVLAVTNGWISRSEVLALKTLDNLQVEGHYAAAFLPASPKTPVLYFIKEDAEWKIALWKSFEVANAAMAQMQQQSRLPEREFLIDVLKKVSKYIVDPRIFDGPLD